MADALEHSLVAEARSTTMTARRRPRYRLKDVPLLIETFASLTAASLKVRYLPFRIITSAIVRRRVDRRPRSVHLGRLKWAIQGIARRLPLRTMCIETAICLQEMLARRGVVSTLHYGVRRNEEGELAAHVWLSVGGEVVLGGEVAPQFACTASFSSQSSE